MPNDPEIIRASKAQGRHAGKGPQPRRVSMKAWARNYERIFRKDKNGNTTGKT